mgnify:CR=1 FL=1|tara:strand:- start:246 stop:557 length:312 start_codon:yes stop_codon:yes gene_type:complete
MKSYLQGFITGIVFISSFFIFIGSESPQLNAIENEIIKIWEKEKQHDNMIKDNKATISSLESDIDIHSKSIDLYIKSLRKDFNKLINQLNEHCECYRNQNFFH